MLDDGTFISFYSIPVAWISFKWQEESYIQGYGQIISSHDWAGQYKIKVLHRRNKQEWNPEMYEDKQLMVEEDYAKAEPDYMKQEKLEEFLNA